MSTRSLLNNLYASILQTTLLVVKIPTYSIHHHDLHMVNSPTKVSFLPIVSTLLHKFQMIAMKCYMGFLVSSIWLSFPSYHVCPWDSTPITSYPLAIMISPKDTYGIDTWQTQLGFPFSNANVKARAPISSKFPIPF